MILFCLNLPKDYKGIVKIYILPNEFENSRQLPVVL